MSIATEDFLARRYLEENPTKTFMTETGSRIYYLVQGDMTCYYAIRDVNFRKMSPEEIIEVYKFIQEQMSS